MVHLYDLQLTLVNSYMLRLHLKEQVRTYFVQLNLYEQFNGGPMPIRCLCMSNTNIQLSLGMLCITISIPLVVPDNVSTTLNLETTTYFSHFYNFPIFSQIESFTVAMPTILMLFGTAHVLGY